MVFYMFFTDLITYVKKTYFERTNVTTWKLISLKAYANEGISPLSWEAHVSRRESVKSDSLSSSRGNPQKLSPICNICSFKICFFYISN